MEHTKKMILIEPEVIERLKSRDTIHEDSLSRLDKEMKNILKSKIDDREKWLLYMQILQRYLHFAGEERRPLSLPVIEEDDQKFDTKFVKKESKGDNIAVNTSSEDDKHALDSSIDILYSTTHINKFIPKTYRKKANILLNTLLSNKDKIKWQNDGVIIIDNQVVDDSNIIDLVNYTLRPLKRSKPSGWEKFIDSLKSIGVPPACIGNPEALENINDEPQKIRRRSFSNDGKSPDTLSSYTLRKKNMTFGKDGIHTRYKRYLLRCFEPSWLQ